MSSIAASLLTIFSVAPSVMICDDELVDIGNSRRPGVTGPWSQGDFLDALVVYGFDKAELPKELARKCEAKCGARCRLQCC